MIKGASGSLTQRAENKGGGGHPASRVWVPCGLAISRSRVSDLSVGKSVSGPFLARDKQLRSFTNKQGNFLLLTLQDNTGEIGAVMWDNSQGAFDAFEDGDIIWVDGEVRLHNKALQVIISSLSPCPKENYDIRDFLPHTKKDVNALQGELLLTVNSIRNPFLARLLESFFSDLEWVGEFKEAPGAKSVHHAYIGGLLEHTVGVVRILQRVAEIYPLNRDLLLTGGILHDIGKMVEYRYDGLIDYTDEGRLVGHVVIGARMVEEHIKRIQGFPRELGMLLCHMILSHHGEYEFGSPKRPKFAEASALHYADNLDAEVSRFIYITETQRKDGKRWSPHDKFLDRYVYIGGTAERTSDDDAGEHPSGKAGAVQQRLEF